MQSKVYGNSSSDGFALYAGIITTVFVAGGIGLAKVGAVAILAGIPVFAILVVAMAMRAKKWDVMSDTSKAEVKTDVKVVTFPVAAQNDSTPVVAAASWSPSAQNETSLPAAVTKPKSPIETNTDVAA